MRYTDLDQDRVQEETSPNGLNKEEYRTEWRRDYARVLHTPAFRRLQGKTQLFPGQESDFFRNRLTHSLEVSQIGVSIAHKLNHDLLTYKDQGHITEEYRIEPAIVEMACLAHDLGHPPFGHLGEYVLNEKMKHYGGFEGNAQTLRLVAILERKFPDSEVTSDGKDNRYGLNLTYRSLAAVLKYDNLIPVRKDGEQIPDKLDKGFYKSETELVRKVKSAVAPGFTGEYFKTTECMIMDIADDIAYSTYDLEDAFKAGFLSPMQMISAGPKIWKRVVEKVNDAIEKEGITERLDDVEAKKYVTQIFAKYLLRQDDSGDFLPSSTPEEQFDSLSAAFNASALLALDGRHRITFTSYLVGMMVREVELPCQNINQKFPALSVVRLSDKGRIIVEILKRFTWEYQIMAPRLQIANNRGREIVSTIFDCLVAKDGFNLLPPDFYEMYNYFDSNEEKHRVICDFVAGMTDRYAIEFYGRLKSENAETIFKPY